MTKPANAQDFDKWENKARRMTREALEYSAKDCRDAANKMKGFDAIAEGRYSDEAASYEIEILRRKDGGEMKAPDCHLSLADGMWCVIHKGQAVSAARKEMQFAIDCGARCGASKEIYWNGDKGEFRDMKEL